MLKKVWKFQQIIMRAVNFNIKTRRAFFAGMLFAFIFLLLSSINAGIILNELGLYSFYLILAAACLNDVMKPKIKLYKCIPVSNRFMVGNLLMFPLVVILLEIAATAALVLSSAVLVNIILGCIFLFSGGKVNPFAWSPDEETATAVSPALPEWKSYLFLFFVMVILYFGFAVITFIKRRVWRMIGYAAFFAVATALSYALGHCLLGVPGAAYNFIDTFPLSKNADAILLGTGLFTALVVPAAVKLANRLYKGRHGGA